MHSYLITTNSDNGQIAVIERLDDKTEYEACQRAEELVMTGKAGATGTVCLYKLAGCVKSVTKAIWSNKEETDV